MSELAGQELVIVLKRTVKKLLSTRILLGGFSPKHAGVTQALDVLRQLGIACTYEEDLGSPDVRAFKPDVVIIYSTRKDFLTGATPHLVKMKCRRALWYCDLRPPNVAAICAGAFDGVFLPWFGRFNDQRFGLGDCDAAAWARTMRARVWHMPQAAEIRVPQVDLALKERVVFVGDLSLPCHRGRRKLCESLGARVLNSHHRGERSHITKRSWSLYPSSDFSLSLSPPASGYTSNRTYNILAWGGLLLLQYYPSFDRQFESGKHALVFRTEEQAHRRVSHFSRQIEQANQIRRDGWELARRKHAYAHRILNIASNVLGMDASYWGDLEHESN